MGLFNIFKKNNLDRKILTTNIANRCVFNVTEGAAKGFYQVGLSKEGLEIIKPLKSKPIAIISYKDIADIEADLMEKDTLKDKSIVKRAIVGKLVAGNLGAVVGAMSGTGSISIKELDLYLTIKINNKNDLKMEGLSLKGDNINKAKTFIKFLQFNLSNEDSVDKDKNSF